MTTTTTTATPPKVFSAISTVMAALAKEGITKSQTNTMQGYKFRGIDSVYNALSPFLAAAKLVIVPHFADRDVVERQSAKGGALFYVTLSGTFTFVSAEDGSQFDAGPFYGEAMDSGDKATNKAMSAAFKYMAMEVFCIPTEGDNDADATTHTVAPVEPSDEDLELALKLSTIQSMPELQTWWAKLDAGQRKRLSVSKDKRKSQLLDMQKAIESAQPA